MVRNDGGPRTPGRPMDTFAAEFLDRQARHWKPRTRETNSRSVRKDILLAFGHLTVDSIAAEHVRDWFAAMSDRPGIANRAMPTLSMMMHMAELWGYRLPATGSGWRQVLVDGRAVAGPEPPRIGRDELVVAEQMHGGLGGPQPQVLPHQAEAGGVRVFSNCP